MSAGVDYRKDDDILVLFRFDSAQEVIRMSLVQRVDYSPGKTSD